VNLPQIKIINKDINLDLSSYEALIFSSKNAVKAIDNINKDWKKIPSYAIGNPTANEILKFDGIVEFIATSSYGDEFAQELILKLKDKKVLFLRAKKILSDLENILKSNRVNLKSEIVYETACRDKKPIDIQNKNSVFIFTSPSTIECFFNQYKWEKSYIAICIGNVTAKALPYTIFPHISKIQTIASCIELAKTLIKQN
jgi:uroporphyrinogen-III synthase